MPSAGLALRYRLEAAALSVVRGVARALPDRVSWGVGRVIGLGFFWLDAPHRRLAIRQLQSAFPLRSARECRAIARQTFVHFGQLLAVLIKFSTLSRDEIRARVDFEGAERVRAACEAGKGAILSSGHFGFWEMQAIAHAVVLPPMQVLARPLDNPALHRWLEDTRRMTGNGVIYRKGAVRKVLRALERNEIVAIMIDQHIQNADAVMVDFFNRPAATTNALAALALRTGAPVIPVFALPLPGGRFRMVYDHPVEPPVVESGREDEAIRVFTQRCTDVLEMYVRRYPHLWLWMHRRWRDPATGEEAVVGMFPRATSDQDARMTE